MYQSNQALLAEIRFWSQLIEAEKDHAKPEVLEKLRRELTHAQILLGEIIGDERDWVSPPWVVRSTAVSAHG